MPEEVKSTTFPAICAECKGKDFKEEKGVIKGAWGFSHMLVAMKICTNCGEVSFKYLGKNVFSIRRV